MREFKMSHEWNVPATPPDPHSYYSDEPHFYPQVTEAQAYGQGFYPDNELVRRPPFGPRPRPPFGPGPGFGGPGFGPGPGFGGPGFGGPGFGFGFGPFVGGLAGGLLAGTLVNAFDEGPYYPGPGYGPYPGPYQPYY